MWDVERTRKEASLMWMIWHKAVAMNARRGAISAKVDQSCSVCLCGIKETVMHGFWECPAAQKAWSWCESIMNYLVPIGEGSRGICEVSNPLGCKNLNSKTINVRHASSLGKVVHLSINLGIGDAHEHEGYHPLNNRREQDDSNNEIWIDSGTSQQRFVLNWKQGIFGHRLPSRFKVVSRCVE